ncbi:MAG: Asp-tRNA(Asn)/Glu-tRNA(Gln) amidotransferase subunit GatC [bacterium]|nr:Asp-tRNA(Asn)/Glu-tRNA(Gln) amidotransferase subunit GatC [bacterium]
MNNYNRDTLKQMIREARLKIPADAEDKLADEVAQLLHNLEVLSEVDVGEGIERMTLSPDELRPDVTEEPQSKNKALANAPDTRDGYIVVPRVLPGEEGDDE